MVVANNRSDGDICELVDEAFNINGLSETASSRSVLVSGAATQLPMKDNGHVLNPLELLRCQIFAVSKSILDMKVISKLTSGFCRSFK